MTQKRKPARILGSISNDQEKCSEQNKNYQKRQDASAQTWPEPFPSVKEQAADPPPPNYCRSKRRQQKKHYQTVPNESMTRVKRGVISRKKRTKILKYTKGFKWGRKSKERAAKEALLHAWTHAFRGRKEKKRNFRGLWQVKINAAAREGGLSYSRLSASLKKKGIALNRKILADLAENEPETFKKVVASAVADEALADKEATTK